jgi:putative spermidine/putrescine transport system ATP-binding protein
VALARAIVFDPRLLLMDEPLGALDKKLREALQLEVRRISTQLGITVLYVTHDQEEALVISDRIAIYNHGRIEQVGTGEDLYERPTSYFVADFMGESNIFRGERERHGAVRTAAGTLRVEDGSGAAGERVAVVVRPERLELSTGPAPEDGAARNAVPATVSEAIYLGSARRYELETADGLRLSARVPMGGTGEALAAGQEVEVRWRVEDGVVVADPVTGREGAGRPGPEEEAAALREARA